MKIIINCAVINCAVMAMTEKDCSQESKIELASTICYGLGTFNSAPEDYVFEEVIFTPEEAIEAMELIILAFEGWYPRRNWRYPFDRISDHLEMTLLSNYRALYTGGKK